MTCLNINTENNNLIISENSYKLETENSNCTTPSNNCLLLETESNLTLKSEIDIPLETENSNCILINISIFQNSNNIKDPYFRFTRQYGFKYNKEDKFKYTRSN